MNEASQLRFALVPADGGNPIVLDRDLTVVGRHPDCDVRFDSRRISRLHCCLAVLGPNALLVRDLGSTNGTFVNGRRIREARISPGDTLRLAEMEFRLVTHDESASITPQQMPGPSASDDELLIELGDSDV